MRRIEHRAIGRAALAAGALIAMLSMAPPAAADESLAISYSLDGLNWSASPPASILPAGWIAVPGGSQQGSLHLRAERPGATLVALFAAPARSDDPVLVEALRVTGEGGRAVTVDGTTRCSALAPQTVLHQGETMQVPIGVALDAGLVGGQNRPVSLKVLVALSDTAAAPLPNGCPVDPAVIPLLPVQGEVTATALPRTGGDIPLLAAAAAIAAVIGGIVAIRTGGARRHG
ncbi:hypothetical protein HD600_000948 [Microbacterium ginsengiterrae]|uniref:LPXTG-motif cell wall-anchored protein n=1 Tax=Microbacterium ginsengiterrae TaxID=546115 RepID=A0A7W9FAN6_9MICO|nr:hypothetical protein [Microbacterium ginsengiterrae]MBB5742451.1 hypothetical protein [Microbacterium ginsengiterrae]